MKLSRVYLPCLADRMQVASKDMDLVSSTSSLQFSKLMALGLLEQTRRDIFC
jgi:hypothetical protein